MIQHQRYWNNPFAGNDPGLRNFRLTAPVRPEDVTLGFPEASISSHVVGAWNDCEEQDRPLPWLPFQPSPRYYGPASFPLTIHCLLFSSCEDCCFIEWRGPGLFSSLTCREDVFAFLHSTLPGEVSWLNTSLTITSRLSGSRSLVRNFTGWMLLRLVKQLSVSCMMCSWRGISRRPLSWIQGFCP
jgi:hypothetical protein